MKSEIEVTEELLARAEEHRMSLDETRAIVAEVRKLREENRAFREQRADAVRVIVALMDKNGEELVTREALFQLAVQIERMERP